MSGDVPTNPRHRRVAICIRRLLDKEYDVGWRQQGEDALSPGRVRMRSTIRSLQSEHLRHEQLVWSAGLG
jgi:hypothetical protein